MPLPEIADFLQNRDVDRIKAKLQSQKQAVIQKQKELQRIERKIDNRLHQLQEAQGAVLDVIEVVESPSCNLVWVEDSRSKMEYYSSHIIYRLQQSEKEEEALVFLGKIGISISARHLREQCFNQYDGIFLVLDKEDIYAGDTVNLPASRCVRVRFCGSHAEAPAQYRKLFAYIQEQKMEIAGFFREITIIDYGITNDTKKFVTEISIPVCLKEG